MILVSFEAMKEWHDEHKEATELDEAAAQVELDVHYGDEAPALCDIDFEMLDKLTPREAYNLGRLAASRALLNSHGEMLKAQPAYNAVI